MQSLPHHYKVAASAGPHGELELESDGLAPLLTAPPREFDGPGNRWSPETLLVAAVTDCFVFSFRAIAAANKFAWTRLTCRTVGTLDKVDGVTRFTEFGINVELQVTDGTDEARAQRLLTRAERACLISNSLKASVHVTAQIRAT